MKVCINKHDVWVTGSLSPSEIINNFAVTLRAEGRGLFSIALEEI